MLLYRIENEEKKEIISMFESSNVLSSTYNVKNNTMEIVFKNGGKYRYLNVPMVEYTKFELCESQGKYINSNIKQYQTEKLENVDINVILKEIEEFRRAELSYVFNNIKENVDNVVENFNNFTTEELNQTLIQIKNAIKTV
jgi:hypothetical protein